MAEVASAGQDIQLILQPRLCVITAAESACDSQILAEWRSLTHTPYSLCLYQQNNPQPLQCWQEVALGKAELHRVLRQSTQFLLKNAQDQVVGSQTYEVIVEAPHYSRPRRNPWSFY